MNDNINPYSIGIKYYEIADTIMNITNKIIKHAEYAKNNYTEYQYELSTSLYEDSEQFKEWNSNDIRLTLSYKPISTNKAESTEIFKIDESTIDKKILDLISLIIVQKKNKMSYICMVNYGKEKDEFINLYEKNIGTIYTNLKDPNNYYSIDDNLDNHEALDYVLNEKIKDLISSDIISEYNNLINGDNSRYLAVSNLLDHLKDIDNNLEQFLEDKFNTNKDYLKSIKQLLTTNKENKKTK